MNQRQRVSGVAIEGLETRQLLSATVVGNTLTIVGSNKSDVITVAPSATAGMVDVTENGVTTSFDLAGLASISMSGGNGNDTMSVAAGVALPVSMSGGNGKDVLTGGDMDDVLDGGNGKDVLKGGLGNDHLTGGNGNDDLDGQDGDDTLDGGKGKDHVVGGLGSDHFQASEAAKEVVDDGTDDVLEGVLKGGKDDGANHT